MAKDIVDQLMALIAEIGSGERLPYSTIYADPPWRYSNQATRSATNTQYRTLASGEIERLPVADLGAEQCHLHLWTTNAFLFDAKQIIDAWGFEYKSCLVWVKPQMGIGNYWRVSHEFLLLGVRGKLAFQDHSQKSWLQVGRGRHSAKPEQVRERIESVSPPPRLELFGRRDVPDWDVCGDEVERDLLATVESI